MDIEQSKPVNVTPPRYVLLPLANVLTGYTVKAIQRKIERGDWQEGKVWRRAPDGRILIDLIGYEMGRKSLTSGVQAKGRNRIQFDFEFEGVRYRPTIERIPSEGNLRRASKQLEDIKGRIAHGTFNFAEEFPDYRGLPKVAATTGALTCNDVFDDFLQHCESRLGKSDLAFITVDGYRRILNGVWRPQIGAELFAKIRYTQLVKIADGYQWKKKTYNNVISALRCAFEYGYRDHPEKHNPASGLKCFRITKKDRPAVDPFSIHEAEALIRAIHLDWGEAQGNYDEFRFFTGLRPSEQIALLVSDCDLSQGKIQISKARVAGRDKDRTKTSEDRIVDCVRERSMSSGGSSPCERA